MQGVSLVLLLALCACAPTATLHLKEIPTPLEGEILRSNPHDLVVVPSGELPVQLESQRRGPGVVLPRDQIVSIEHPGKVAAAIGTSFTALSAATLMTGIGAAGSNASYAADLSLGGTLTGLGVGALSTWLMVWGWDTLLTSAEHAQDQAGRPYRLHAAIIGTSLTGAGLLWAALAPTLFFPDNLLWMYPGLGLAITGLPLALWGWTTWSQGPRPPDTLVMPWWTRDSVGLSWMGHF